MNQLNIVRFVTSALAACIAASALVSCADEYPSAEVLRGTEEYHVKRKAALIETIKATCAALGFTPGSVAFGQCAMHQLQLDADEQQNINQFYQQKEQLRKQEFQQNLDRMLNRQPSTPVLNCTTDAFKRTTCQ
jgi:activator of 2-hydroxyglutaryl-CoA dehydratase